MDPVTIGVIAGTSVLVGTLIARKRGEKLAPTVLPVLRDKGPMTIPELMAALGLEGMNARGKVVLALDSLVRTKQVAEGPVPPGTPQLDKIKVRKYSALA
jgi:hypothetical protein